MFPSITEINKMELSREQQIAFNKYIEGHNIFITGPGGSGKTELIKQIREHAYKSMKNIHVTALTGCAAILLNCKATTLHSWAGIGLGKGSIEEIVMKIQKNKSKKDKWREIEILVVDEVSMMSEKLFNTLNIIGKYIRKNNKPFGGIQVIFSGDFYQLPPVGDIRESETTRFCFESSEWYDVFTKENQVQLQKIFRQTDDIYSSVLNQIRQGIIKQKTNTLLISRVGVEPDKNMIIEPTKLFPTKNKVEYINNSKMVLLTSQEKKYLLKYLYDEEISKKEKEQRIMFTPTDIKIELEFLESNLMCDKEVKLKVGAQVMCIINIKSPSGDVIICNGSQGIIKEFCGLTGYPIVEFRNGIKMTMERNKWLSERIPGIGISQVPLILSWALTIHKSQGSTLDVAEIDIGSGIFECGQTYVALSRVKSLDGLYLSSFDITKIKINKKVQEYYKKLSST